MPDYVMPEDLSGQKSTGTQASTLLKTGGDTVTKINELVVNGNKLIENLINLRNLAQPKDSSQLTEAQITAKANKMVEQGNIERPQPVQRNAQAILSIEVARGINDLRALALRLPQEQKVGDLIKEFDELNSSGLVYPVVEKWIKEYAKAEVLYT